MTKSNVIHTKRKQFSETFFHVNHTKSGILGVQFLWCKRVQDLRNSESQGVLLVYRLLGVKLLIFNQLGNEGEKEKKWVVVLLHDGSGWPSLR